MTWNPLVNVLGLRAGYELRQVAGRYISVTDERTKPHTTYSLARPRWFTMVDVVKHVPLVARLVDAEYASAIVAVPRRPATFSVVVSPTGLLIRSGGP